MVKATYDHSSSVSDLTITGIIASIGSSPMTDKQAGSFLVELADMLESYDFEARALTISIK